MVLRVASHSSETLIFPRSSRVLIEVDDDDDDLPTRVFVRRSAFAQAAEAANAEYEPASAPTKKAPTSSVVLSADRALIDVDVRDALASALRSLG